MNKKEIFENRQLSWLAFNERVLEEAEDKKNPLLERLKFLAIFSSNLDEFFMIRVANLRILIEEGIEEADNSGYTPKEQVERITDNLSGLISRQYAGWDKVCSEIEQHGIYFKSLSEINQDLKDHLGKLFDQEIFPAITPMAVDPTHPFPFIYTNTLNILCAIDQGGDEEHFAIVPVPGILPRFYIIEWQGEKYFFLIEEIIIEFLAKLFPGHNINDQYPFRITRNADLEVDEEGASDLLKELEDRLKERRKGSPVRLEINRKFQDRHLEKFKEEFEITDDMIFNVDGPVDLTFGFALFGELAGIIPGASDPEHTPYYYKIDDVFSLLKRQDVFLHHPYDSFQTVIDMLEQAANDPNVLAIKMTLYRTTGDKSKVVKQLLKAIENGKQVTTLVELKARFDEERNIEWAKKLEENGIHVVYGVKGLKTHSKVLLIVRREEDGTIKRYMQFGTGNYNEKTAGLYTDVSLMTSDDDLAFDISAFFNYLTGYSILPDWRKIAVSPNGIRDKLLQLIDNEIQVHSKAGRGEIMAKMNALVEPGLIEKLYEASKAGVKITLIIRGICCLRAGVKGLSENIRVVSIVGSFLEHSRIFYFRNAGDEMVYMSSADWMPRNLFKRVELMIPIEKDDLKKQAINILKYNVDDNVKARKLLDKKYTHVETPKSKKKIFNAQDAFIKDRKKMDKKQELVSKSHLLEPMTQPEAEF